MAITFTSYAVLRSGSPTPVAGDSVGTMYHLQAVDVDAELPLDPVVTLTPLRGWDLWDEQCVMEWVVRSGDDSVSVYTGLGWPQFASGADARKAWLKMWLERRGYKATQLEVLGSDPIEYALN